MRKSLLLGFLLLLLALSPALAQQSKRTPTPPLDPVTQLVTYTETVGMANLSQDTLATRAQRWFRRQFTGVQQAPERGGRLGEPHATMQGTELLANGWEEQSIQLPAGGTYYRLHFTWQLLANEQGYSCTFTNFTIGPSEGDAQNQKGLIPLETKRIDPSLTKAQRADVLAQCYHHVAILAQRQLSSLKEAMSQPIPGSYQDLHRFKWE